MKLELTANEQRVIGCLLEKETTTPEQYPLSLNALTNACNQKSNREPVMALSESDVQDTLVGLKEKRLISIATGSSSRVMKYRHRFCNTEFGELKLTEQERGILCVLFLRGPQTPGELRTRTNRLCEFSDVSEVDSALNELTHRSDGPFLVKLERIPGKRESRYAHLLGDTEQHDSVEAPTEEPLSSPSTENTSPHNAKSSNESSDESDNERIAYLELRVDDLESKLAEIMKRLD